MTLVAFINLAGSGNDRIRAVFLALSILSEAILLFGFKVVVCTIIVENHFVSWMNKVGIRI